jgi:hypothetical protein
MITEVKVSWHMPGWHVATLSATCDEPRLYGNREHDDLITKTWHKFNKLSWWKNNILMKWRVKHRYPAEDHFKSVYVEIFRQLLHTCIIYHYRKLWLSILYLQTGHNSTVIYQHVLAKLDFDWIHFTQTWIQVLSFSELPL